MLDGKILAAVFDSLAAIGTAMSGGHIDSGDLQSIKNPSDSGMEDFLPGSLGAFTEFVQRPEPDTEVEAELEIDDLAGQNIKVTSASLHARNLTEVELGKRRISSDEEIHFYGFKGTVDPGTPTDFEGKADGIDTSGVNISGGFKTEEEVSTGKIVLNKVVRSKIQLTGITGVIKSNTTSTTISDDDSSLSINSFSGNITVLPRNKTVKLDGKVGKLKAGKVSLG